MESIKNMTTNALRFTASACVLASFVVALLNPFQVVGAQSLEELREIVKQQQEQIDEALDRRASSGNDKIKLSISGQTNRAMNLVDDGDSTEAYFVDNDVTNTRVRFVGTAEANDTTTMGTRLEIALSPNNSYDVSQDNETADDFTDVRKAEAFVRDDRYGQLSFGKGSAAADDTAEYDLSLVSMQMYSGIADPVGGIQFTSNDALTGVAVGDAFFNFDGGRQSRVRYDSPNLGPGVQLSVSVGSDDREDIALTWGGDYGNWSGVDIGSFTTLGAISISDPNEDDVDYRLAGSFSALHNPTDVSYTIGYGMDKLDSSGDDPYNLYIKIGWDRSIYSVGPTGFGVDYTYSENNTQDDDEGTSFGLAVVQVLENYGTEIYAQYRFFDLDTGAGPDFEEIHAATLGTRVKF